MQKLILHIPHSSIVIPSKEGYVISQETLDEEIGKLTDWHTDDLFSNTRDISVIATFSRLFCDAERFVDDAHEVMAKYGMGVLYETLDNGDLMRKVTQDLKGFVIENYYKPHHQQLNEAVLKALNQSGKGIVIDCHSFPSTLLKRSLVQVKDTPDYNIGTDTYHTPQNLIDFSKAYFEDLGCSLGINTPHSGALVPMEHYQNNKNVQAIMLEVNRRLYLKETTNEKSENYQKTKEVVQGFLEGIRNL